MTFTDLKDAVGELSKDTKLNLSSMLKPKGVEGLSDNQIFATALACAYWTKDNDLISAVREASGDHISEEEVSAAKTAAILMAMNNIYYRFVHLSEDKEFGTLPAKLRMTGIGNPGVEKTDFEIYCLAVSALSGCGMCINAHVNVLKKVGVKKEGIQSAVRIASVINSAAQTLSIRRVE